MTSRSETPETPVTVINLTRTLAIRLAVYGTGVLGLGLVIVAVLYGKSAYHHPGDAWLLPGLKITAAFFMTLALHEAIHGFFFWVFGGHPQYGAGVAARFLPYFYAASPGDAFTLFQMTVISLAPFVILSAASLALMVLAPASFSIGAAAFVTNSSGAVGDLWLVAQIFRFRRCRDLWMIDMKTGLAIYSSDPLAKAISEQFPLERTGALSRLLIRWIAASVIMYVSVFPAAILVDVLHLGSMTIGPSWFPLFSVESIPGQVFGVSVDITPILVAGLLLALIYLPFDLRKRRRRADSGPGASPHPAFL